MKRILAYSLLVFFASGCATAGSYRRTPDQAAVSDFDNGNIDSSIYGLEALAQKKDKDYALWKNQLGSAYLAKGDHERALAAFMDAFYTMNNVAAFKELESRSTGFMDAESNKGYKGDPYERMYNSLYVGLLLMRKGDLENARAAFKNGILSDSDSTEEKYKSDEPLLYILEARIEYLLGNASLGSDLFKQGVNALNNSGQVDSDLQLRYEAHKRELEDLRLAVSQDCSNNVGGGCDLSKLNDYDRAQAVILQDSLISKEIAVREEEQLLGEVAKDPKVVSLEKLINKDYNVFLVVESGKGPSKIRSGKYGESAIFLGEDNSMAGVGVSIDGQDVGALPIVADVYYQATTRGGRKMDSILKGKAQFKESAAETSKNMMNVSNEFLKQGNQSTDPNAQMAAAMLAGASAVAGMMSSLVSHITNPEADIRHWSLLPDNLWVFPVKLSPGKHKIEFIPFTKDNSFYLNLVRVIEVDVKPNMDNICFARLHPHLSNNYGKKDADSSYLYVTLYSGEEKKADVVPVSFMAGINLKNFLSYHKAKDSGQSIPIKDNSSLFKGADNKTFILRPKDG